MTDPIRAALDKAAEAVRVSLIKDGSCLCGDTCPALPCKCASDAMANAIAAFLRALHRNGITAIAEGNLPWLADYVLAAAKDQAND